MQRSLIFKALMIAALALLLMIPLSMIKSTISERASRRDAVQAEISKTDTGEQTVAGPVLVLPYTLVTRVIREVDGVSTAVDESSDGVTHILPGKLAIDGRVSTQTRHRGLFEALFYDSRLKVSGHFDVPPEGGLTLRAGQSVTWGTPYVAVGIADNRGIQNVPQLSWNSASFNFAPGNPVAVLGSGIHAAVVADAKKGGHFEYTFDLDLHGTSRLGWLPLGENTHVHLTSPWPHPGFTGNSLPRVRTVTSKGFEAEWESSHFASNMPQLFNEALKAGDMRLMSQSQDVNFVQPVDIYQQAERSVKYGFLFVLLTFAAFALFEILKQLPIHPVQYGLVGIALALFFLMLIALSEHMSFGLSYLLASGACLGLLLFYLSHVLRSALRGLGFGALLTLLYGALYGLLISEDNALLMGSLLLFVLLAGVMMLTRKVDWYALGGDKRQTVREAAGQAV